MKNLSEIIVSESDQRALALLNVIGITLENTSFPDWIDQLENARITIRMATKNGLPFDAQLVKDHKEFFNIK